MNAFRRLLVPLAAVSALAAPALADDGMPQGPVTHTDQLIVVTPNPPVVITNGAGPGATDPEPAPAAQAAPHNEDWSNVNHINGQLVKVGEKGDYLIKFRKTNIATNPIGWMFGIYGVSVSQAVSENVAIRGDANFISIDNESGYELGISAPIYFRRTYSGPFLEPGLITRGSSSSYDDCGDCSSSYKMVGPEILFGWHWTFDSGLNVAMAFGAARNMNSESSNSDPEPAGYFRIGYAM
jgi:hypothetical protein